MYLVIFPLRVSGTTVYVVEASFKSKSVSFFEVSIVVPLLVEELALGLSKSIRLNVHDIVISGFNNMILDIT